MITPFALFLPFIHLTMLMWWYSGMPSPSTLYLYLHWRIFSINPKNKGISPPIYNNNQDKYKKLHIVLFTNFQAQLLMKKKITQYFAVS